jgi:hypothetical protein
MVEILTPTPEQQTTELGTTLTLTKDSQSPVWKAGIEVEAETFIESDYVKSAAELQEEYRLYLPETSVLAASRDGKVVGGGRVISYNPEIGFKTFHDIDDDRLELSDKGKEILRNIDPRHMMEIGTLGIKKEWRKMPGVRTGINLEMYGAIWGISTKNNTPYILASFDGKYFERFSRYFGDSVKPLGPAIEYMGSLTVPVIMNLEETYANLTETNPELLAVLDGARQKLSYEHRSHSTDDQ